MKNHILLDLDQTLISSELVDEFDIKDANKKNKFNYSNMDNYYYVFERPGLQKFLSYLFKNFKVSIWTAASKEYALFIINNIILKGKKGRKIEWIFYSYHCELSKKLKGSIKNLNLLTDVFNINELKKCIIFDDNEEVYETQPKRCIIVKPFNFTDINSENDNYLKEVVKELKKGNNVNKINNNLNK